MANLYLWLGGLEVLMVMTAIAQSVFLIKAPKTRERQVLFWGSFLLFQTLGTIFPYQETANALLPFLFLMIFLRRRIIFFFPITGIVLSLLFIPFLIVYMFNGSMDQVLEIDNTFWILMDLLFWILWILFIIKKRQWNRLYPDFSGPHKRSFWENTLLWGTGTVLLVLFFLLSAIDDFHFSPSLAKGFILCGTAILGIMLYAILAVTIQGNLKAHFEREAALNEYYLNAQLKHFKSFEKTQKETRRIRHDIKNHTAVLYTLLEKEQFEEARQYIKEFNDVVNHPGERFHLGDPIIDAIINEKDSYASTQEIRLTAEGIPGFHHMDPLDVCTIFANALDNAIEAQKELRGQDKWIHVSFVNQNAMQYIRIENPAKEVHKNGSFFVTTKDPGEHGIGLGNIKRAVEKYYGQMNVSYHNGIFTLELLFTTK